MSFNTVSAAQATEAEEKDDRDIICDEVFADITGAADEQARGAPPHAAVLSFTVYLPASTRVSASERVCAIRGLDAAQTSSASPTSAATLRCWRRIS